jgi:hypothetical protein
VEDKSIAIAGEHEGNIEGDSAVEGLLHRGADAVGVIFGFNQGEWMLGLK